MRGKNKVIELPPHHSPHLHTNFQTKNWTTKQRQQHCILSKQTMMAQYLMPRPIPPKSTTKTPIHQATPKVPTGYDIPNYATTDIPEE